MKTLSKPALLLVLLVISVVVAAVFGALHNQLSYSVGASYFHDLKFAQFRIPPEYHNRLGAALVGLQASWWMGLVAGIPAFVLGLFWISRPAVYFAAGISAIGAVVALTLVAAIVGLTLGLFSAEAEFAKSVPIPDNVTDRAGFLRAALMHEASYGGGLLGLLAAIWAMWRVGRSEKPEPQAEDLHET